MKPVAFDYARPASLADAVRLLDGEAGAKVLAGGQTLGPMLNLRLAQPAILVDITRIAELARCESNAGDVVLGACVTHAAIEDGRVPDPAGGLMREVAHGIAYRAVRTRGTIGGSLAHADPAADWLSCLTALDAQVLLAGPAGRRRVPVAQLMRGAMESDVGKGELIEGIRVPRLGARARTGYHKICRKTGEFAEAIGVAVDDPERGRLRLVAGATGGRPIVIDGETARPDRARLSGLVRAGLSANGSPADVYAVSVLATALDRAISKAHAA